MEHGRHSEASAMLSVYRVRRRAGDRPEKALEAKDLGSFHAVTE